jgi:hypothetical protein
MLGAEVRMIEVDGLLEHVFGEPSGKASRDGNRAHVMKATGPELARETQRIARSRDIRPLEIHCIRIEIVQGRQVKKVLNITLERGQPFRREAQQGLVQVAFNRHNARPVGPAL